MGRCCVEVPASTLFLLKGGSRPSFDTQIAGKTVKKLLNNHVGGESWNAETAKRPVSWIEKSYFDLGRGARLQARKPKKQLFQGVLWQTNAGTWQESGQGRARTADTGLFRAVLYQLSYLT